MEDIKISEYTQTDRSSCIDLLKAVFSESNESTFNWRFENSDMESPIIVCAKHRGRVISFNSWIPWMVVYKGKKYSGYQSGESATDPEYRGKGLFGKLLRYGEKLALEKKVDFIFGFPSKMSYGSFYRAGYYPISTNHFNVRLINPFKKKIKNANRNLNNKYDYGSMLSQHSMITPVFDEVYIKWRYLTNTKSYDIVEYAENNCKAIFIVRKKKWRGLTELILLDCHYNVYNEMFVKKSFDYLDKVYAKDAVYMRTFFNEYSQKGRMIHKYFPIRIKSKFYIQIIKNISNKIDSNILSNSLCWDFMPHCVDEL